MTHAFDFATATWQSSASGWAAAIEADSCVPDVYSLKNEIEVRSPVYLGYVAAIADAAMPSRTSPKSA
jgi:hypothetical protein